jgi:hypothetical protein
VKAVKEQMRSENGLETVQFLQGVSLLGAFGKSQKATFNFIMCLSFRPSVWNNSAPTGRIFMEFHI